VKILLAPIGIAALLLASAGHSPKASPCRGHCVVRTFSLPSGRAQRTFEFRLHSGYPDSATLVVSRGAMVFVRARADDGLMRLDTSTRPWRRWLAGGWPGGCRHIGAADICTEQFEHCPISPSRWRATVRKTSAAAARVRVELAFTRR
jgi:hypothetical protein